MSEQTPGVAEYERLLDEYNIALTRRPMDGSELSRRRAELDAYVARLEAENARLRESTAQKIEELREQFQDLKKQLGAEDWQ
jgi:chromosome segregation ATPase